MIKYRIGAGDIVFNKLGFGNPQSRILAVGNKSSAFQSEVFFYAAFIRTFTSFGFPFGRRPELPREIIYFF